MGIVPSCPRPMRTRHVVLQTPSKSSDLRQLLSSQQSAPISPLSATLMDPPASVARKRLAAGLSPLSATLKKNRGGGGPAFRRFDIQMRFLHPGPAFGPSAGRNQGSRCRRCICRAIRYAPARNFCARPPLLLQSSGMRIAGPDVSTLRRNT